MVPRKPWPGQGSFSRGVSTEIKLLHFYQILSEKKWSSWIYTICPLHTNTMHFFFIFIDNYKYSLYKPKRQTNKKAAQKSYTVELAFRFSSVFNILGLHLVHWGNTWQKCPLTHVNITQCSTSHYECLSDFFYFILHLCAIKCLREIKETTRTKTRERQL